MPSIEPTSQDYDSLKELASVARLIIYARESAQSLNASFLVWCLDLALGAVLQEMYGLHTQVGAAADDAEAPLRADMH